MLFLAAIFGLIARSDAQILKKIVDRTKQKTEEKVSEKVSEKASDAATKPIDNAGKKRRKARILKQQEKLMVKQKAVILVP